MAGKKKYKNDNHFIEVHRVRYWISKHWTADEICLALKIPYVKVLALIQEAKLIDGEIPDLV